MAMNLRYLLLFSLCLGLLDLLIRVRPDVLMFVGASSVPHACSPPHASFKFCDSSLPVKDRVNDLVSMLTLEEKVMQLVNKAAGIPRLGIPPYEWWGEALHGVSNGGPSTTFGGSVPGATSFPQVILSAASFNVSLWKAIGQVVSTEARAMYNEGLSGLTFWSPNINIYRDPRWGRGQETPGEDPLLSSEYAINFVRGLQDVDGSSSNRIKVAACCKHYTAYDLENWQGVDRFHFDAKVTQQDLGDTYQPPFKNCIVNGNAACVMCSYNRVNGVPSCVDKNLLTGTVREQWGLNGYVVSDCDSVEVLYDDVHYTQSPLDAVADSILAGLNINCGNFLASYTAKAVAQGKLSEKEVDESLSNAYTVLMRLGYFDGNPLSQEHFGMLSASDVCTVEHRKLALDAARQGIVLLKNSPTHGLPLSHTTTKTLAVIGPNADASTTMIGNYAGIPCKYTTPLEGLASYGAKVVYEPGCTDVACTSSKMIDAAVKTAVLADAVVLIMGLDQSQEREGFDRSSLSLPGHQIDLIMQVASSSRGRNKPISLVIMSGGPVDVGFAVNLPEISSILWVGYPGEAGGQAIAEIIFGDHNPGGRLPMSWYPESYTEIPMTDMHMRPDPSRGYPGRTYRFYNKGDAIYEFGHGLSFTTFFHRKLSAPFEIALHEKQNIDSLQTSNHGEEFLLEKVDCASSSFNLRTVVKNRGNRKGDHVVMAFWHASKEHISNGAPKKQLMAFRRILGLDPEQETEVLFNLNVCEHLSYVGNNGRKLLGIGVQKITIGDVEHHVHVHHRRSLNL